MVTPQPRNSRPVRLAQPHARLDRERVPFGSRRRRLSSARCRSRLATPGRRDEVLQVVPAAAYRDPQALAHRVLHGIHHLLGGAHQAHVVRLADESPATPADEIGISRMVRFDGHCIQRMLGERAWTWPGRGANPNETGVADSTSRARRCGAAARHTTRVLGSSRLTRTSSVVRDHGWCGPASTPFARCRGVGGRSGQRRGAGPTSRLGSRTLRGAPVPVSG
jgi:hypothetical protein